MSKEKPEFVDENAWWSSSDKEWVLGAKDDAGEFHGLVTYWRPDGSLVNHCNFEHGTPNGVYKRYHQSGEISRQGIFEAGRIHGTDVFTRSDDETTENFPSGLSEHVWRAEMDMVNGSMVAGRLYNRKGQQVGEDGEPCPERPRDVPHEAVYSSTSGRWVLGKTGESYKRAGLWQFYTQEGWVEQETVYEDGEIKEDTLYRNTYESHAQIHLNAKDFDACDRSVEAGLNELEDDVDCLLLRWIQVQCLSGEGKADKALSLAAETLKGYPIQAHWGRFMPQGQRGYNTRSQIQAFLAIAHIEAERGEEAYTLIREAITQSTRKQALYYVIKANALNLLGRNDDEFSSIKSALSIDSRIDELEVYRNDPKFSEWLQAIDPESMTLEGAWTILGEAGEKLGQYQGVLVPDEDDDEEDEESVERAVFSPEKADICLDHPLDISTLPEENPELAIFAELAGKLDIHNYRGGYSAVVESTLSSAVTTIDGNWLARIQSIFLPASQVTLDDESMMLASWHTTENRTSRVYSIHQDEAEFYHRAESISAMITGSLELNDEDTETTISEHQKNQWLKAASVTEEHEPFESHLELLALEPRTHWIVNLLVGKNPDIVSEIHLGEGINTAASNEDWEREKAFLAWPHLQAYWLFHHAVFGNHEALSEVVEHTNCSYPAVSELANFAKQILAGEEVSEEFWNLDRVSEYRMQALDERSELLSEKAKAQVLEDNKGIFEADNKMTLALETLRKDSKNEGLVSFLEGLKSFGGSLDGVQEALARKMEKPMDFYMSMKKGRVTPFEEFYRRMDILPQRIEEIAAREEPLLALFEAAFQKGGQSPDDNSKVMAGTLYGLGVLTIVDAAGFDAFITRVKSMPFYPDKFGQFRRLELAMLAQKFLGESTEAKKFLRQEAARYAEQAEDWKSDTFDFADRMLTATGDEEQLSKLNARLCETSFSGANWTESVAIAQRFLDNPSPLMASGLKAAVDKELGRHDDGERAIVVRAYAKCAGQEARVVLLNWLDTISDVRENCQKAALLSGLIEIGVDTDQLAETLHSARAVLGELTSGSMKLGAAVSLMKTIHDHRIPGFASEAKVVNENAQT